MSTVYDAFLATAKAVPSKPFLCVPDPEPGASKDTSYQQALDRVTTIRNIYATAGYGHGHRVALLLGQKPEMVLHYLALNGLGVTMVPVNPDYRIEELSYLMSHSESSLVVALSDRVADMEGTRKKTGLSFDIVDIAKFDAGVPNAPTPAPEQGPPGLTTICSILYTSGTTGQPKGCLLSNECHLMAGAYYRDHGGVLTFKHGEDRLYNPSPFYHVNNLTVALTCVILTKNCLITPERFSPNRWWPELISSGATIAHYLGVIPSMLMKVPPSPQDRAHKVRFGFGAGIEPQLHGPFEERFGFPCVEIWGMTETPRVFAANHEPRQTDTRAFGKPMPDYEAKIVDEEGNECPRGQQGELLVRTPGPNPRHGFFSGYLKNEEATEDAWRGGWFHTGDVAIMGEDGMMFFVDRKKNIVRRAGENISAAEVEANILTHPAVAQVAVIAAPDDIREEEVMACVVLKPEAEKSQKTAEDIFAWTNGKMAYYKTPGWMIFLDALPLTPSQRLQRTRIFPPGADPRVQPGVIDLRHLKKRK
jgi:crotonobetaine/carnitine-CoA ligase